MEKRFFIGDVVWLKSSPDRLMTVAGYTKSSVTTHWFSADNTVCMSATFRPSELDKTSKRI